MVEKGGLLGVFKLKIVEFVGVLFFGSKPLAMVF